MKPNQGAMVILMIGLLLACVPARVDAQGPRPELFSLRRSLETALANSDEIRMAEAGLQIANQQVREAWSNVLPEVRFSASYTRNFRVPVAFLPAIIIDPNADPNELIPVRFGADNAWTAGLVLEQPIFEAQAFIGVSTAGRFREVEVERLRGASQLVVSQVRQGYFNALVADEDLRRLTESVNRITETLAETRAMNRAGLTSSYDVLRFEVQLANQEAQVTRAANTVAETRRLLLVDLGLNPSDPIELLGSFIEINLDDLAANTPANREILEFAGFQGGVGDAVRAASELRSDVRQLELNEDLRRSEMRLEQVSYLPEVTLFGNYIISAQDNGRPNFFARGDGQRSYARLVGVRVTLPIFQGFRRDARIDQKRALVRQAEARTEVGFDQAVAQVKGLVEATDEAHQRARGQRLAVTQAERGFEIARALYREGITSQLELTDSEVALRQSEFNYAQAVYDYLVARAQLDEATGRVPLVDVDAQGDRF